jgi:hypothetical protein
MRVIIIRFSECIPPSPSSPPAWGGEILMKPLTMTNLKKFQASLSLDGRGSEWGGAFISSITPSPLMGEGWGEGDKGNRGGF